MTHNTPAPIADKALAERLARLLEQANPDVLGAGWPLKNAIYDAHRSGQLITLAEAQAMVAAERERCAVIAEDHNEDIWSYHTGNRAREGFDPVAEYIRAAATGTKEGE